MPSGVGPADTATVAAALADAHRREWAFVLAATVRVTRDLDRAEECVQEAYARALTAWVADGIPDRPGAWLTTAARRRALDLHRRADTARRALPLLLDDDTDPGPEFPPDLGPVADDRLRLLFICCHPALAPDSRVALTLRLLCGISTADTARAFLVSEATMAARITRAKKKIAGARIPYRMPRAADIGERVATVCDVLHLLFTTGHTAPDGEALVRRELTERALDLARLLRGLLPEDPDVAGLLALLVLTDARRATRTDAEGRLLLLSDQDRAAWDRAAIDEGLGLVRFALARRPTGRYPLMAAIAAVHDAAPHWEVTDWAAIVRLYDTLHTVWPSPVVALNRAVAIGFADGPAAGLAAVEALAEEPQLAGYGYLAAARADFLRRLERTAEARVAYREALGLTANATERQFLEERLAALPAG